MTTTQLVNCVLRVAGQRFEDGSGNSPDTDPFALSGLTVHWGRETTVDQPDISTCTFEVHDQSDTADTALNVGTWVLVEATGQSFPAPDTSTFDDPDLKSADAVKLRDAESRGALTPTGGWRFVPVSDVTRTAGRYVMDFAPAVPSTNPDAWDHVPATSPGQTWEGTITLRIPSGAVAQIQPVLFGKPWWDAQPDGGDVVTVNGDSQHHTVTLTHSPTIPNQWVGIRVEVYPVGRTWDAVDPTQTFDALPLPNTGAAVRTNWARSPRGTGLSWSLWNGTGGVGGTGATSTVAAGDVAGLPITTARRVTWPEETQPTSGGGLIYTVIFGETFPAGTTFTFSGYVRTPMATSVAPQGIFQMDSTTVGTTVGGPTVAIPANTFTRVRLTVTATGDFNRFQLRFYRQGTAGGSMAWMEGSGLLAEQTDELRDWFDGDYSPNPNLTPGWIGAAGTSASELRAPDEGDFSWDDWWAADVTHVDVLAPAAGTSRTVLVFAGRISDVELTYDEDAQAAIYKVTAVDFQADMANIRIGDEPWPAEELEQRAARVLMLAGNPVPGGLEIGQALRHYTVTGRDVDSQPAIELLRDLAQSVDGVLWSATHLTAGPYMEMEDTADRPNVYELVMRPGSPVFTYEWAGTGTPGQSESVELDSINRVTRRNYVLDPSFEYGDGGIVAGISPTTGNTVVKQRTSDSRTGANAVEIRATAPATAVFTASSIADVAHRNGNKYTFSVWVKGSPGRRVAVRLAYRNEGGSSTNSVGSYVTLLEDTWHRISHTFAVPDGFERVRFDVVCRNEAETVAGTDWFFVLDDALLEYTDNPTALPVGEPFSGDTPDVVADVIVVEPTATAGLAINACDVLREPVTWEMDVTDVLTRASIGWLEQTTDDEGKPTTAEHTTTVVFEPSEQVYGRRGYSMSSQLVTETDARAIATKIIARNSSASWRVSGLLVDAATVTVPNDETTAMLLTLLDGTSRNGLLIRVVDLPGWSPVHNIETGTPLYVEGGEYSYEDGEWRLSLNVSDAAAQGRSVEFGELDATWRWDQFDPEMTWADLYGVSA